MTKVRAFLFLVAALLLVMVGCSGDGLEEVGTVELEAAPAGSNAQFVSSTIPASLFPGERRVVTVTMLNNGATPGTNDWNSTYELFRVSTNFGWSKKSVGGTVPVGSNHTFSFVITAPSSDGSYTFEARMRVGGSLFGELVSIPITVSSAVTPMWGCTFDSGASTVPTTLAPGENRAVSIVVNNTGTATWGSSGFYLASKDSPTNLWGNTISAVSKSVAPGGSATFNFTIKAPATAGNYTLKREMRDTNPGGVGDFRSSSFCVDLPITVGGTPPLDAALVSEDFPTTMAPNDSALVTVVMQDTGTETWQNDGNYVLYSLNNPSSLWGVTSANVISVTSTGSNATLTLSITAPPTVGGYVHKWQMRKLSGTGAGFFGEVISIPVQIDAGATPQYHATVVSQAIPMVMTAGEPYQFVITVENAGTQTWSGSNFTLYSTNSPTSLWGTTSNALGAAESVASGAQRVFTINVTAPAAPGTYASSWRMRQLSGVEFFGDTASTSGLEVTLCGNTTVDPGEQCDDGNLDNGDGCSSTCQNENLSFQYDLATDPTGRSLLGSNSLKQLATIGWGDISGDGVADLMVGEIRNYVSPAGQVRNQAGSVYGYLGGGGALSGSSSTVPAGAAFTIIGADANDGLGATARSHIVVGDVTGDGTPDLIVSAADADGVGNARSSAGEVYVISGGTALASAGDLDLAASPAHALLSATIVGAAAGDQITILGAAELTGDSVLDLVIGAPFNDAAGVDAGAVYVIAGGAGITGTIDLAAPGVTVHTILGAGAGDNLGKVAALGDIGGSASSDLVLAAVNHDPSTGSNAGAAWAIFGPITGNHSLALASDFDGKFEGAGANDKLGSSLAIGHVIGSSANDLVIGALQQRKAGVQVGAVNVFAGPISGAGPFGPASASVVILGADSADTLGTAIAIGDMNGDGFGDIGFAASTGDSVGNARSNAGEAGVVLGAALLPASIDLGAQSPDVLVYGAAANDRLGAHPQNLALFDFDGDSRADLCAGSFLGGDAGGLSSPGQVDCIGSPF